MICRRARVDSELSTRSDIDDCYDQNVSIRTDLGHINQSSRDREGPQMRVKKEICQKEGKHWQGYRSLLFGNAGTYESDRR